VLWEIRGMGLGGKLKKYSVEEQEIERFFLEPIEIMLEYYSNINNNNNDRSNNNNN
jgi:hypothetical protein